MNKFLYIYGNILECADIVCFRKHKLLRAFLNECWPDLEVHN